MLITFESFKGVSGIIEVYTGVDEKGIYKIIYRNGRVTRYYLIKGLYIRR